MDVKYQRETELSTDEVVKLYDATIFRFNAEQVERTNKNSNLIVTAREKQVLIGIATCGCNFVTDCYLYTLAVDPKFQRKGVGSRMIEEIRKHAGNTAIIAVTNSQAKEFYNKCGLKPYKYALIAPRKE